MGFHWQREAGEGRGCTAGEGHGGGAELLGRGLGGEGMGWGYRLGRGYPTECRGGSEGRSCTSGVGLRAWLQRRAAVGLSPGTVKDPGA